MKKLLLAVIVSLSTVTTASLAEIKVGIILGFTGPIESLTPAMRDGARMAFDEASNSGNLLDGETITILEADSTCVDSAAATAAAEGLVADGVTAIMGADCSGVTGAINANVAVPNGILMVSPSATSPGLSKVPDNGTFWRTAPSDAKGGQVLAKLTLSKGIESIAITYTNNDYGKGLAEVFEKAFTSGGGTVTAVASHEEDKGDYSSEVGVLASAGGDALLVVGYLDGGGLGIIEASLDSGAFDTFVMSDGMIGQSIVDAIGSDLEGAFGSLPGAISKGSAKFSDLAAAKGLDASGPYVGESYDAAAIIALAIQAGGSADKQSILKNISKVSNAPGIIINPGQLSYGLQMLAAGKDIDYQGATDVEFNALGDANGAFKEVEVRGGSFVTVGAL
jgi:branched-chain amino acid transport system substrate-binding protein